MLSGYADTAAIVESINEGRIYKFILKPWNEDELKIAISNALDSYFLQQKNRQLTRELEIKNKNLQEANNTLEFLVKKRTADLKMYNKALICSQNILNSLPVGVIGIELGGLIVQCNSMGLELFGKEDMKMIGMDRNDLFYEEINTLIKKLTRKGVCSGQISYNGKSLAVKGRHIQYSNRREGFILVFNEVNTDE